MTVQELIGSLFNIALVVMIVATMVSAGFTTTFAAIGRVLSKVLLVVLVLVTGMVLRLRRARAARESNGHGLAAGHARTEHG